MPLAGLMLALPVLNAIGLLTWRKSPTEHVPGDKFTDLAFTDETDREHTWRVADTTISLPIGIAPNGVNAPALSTDPNEDSQRRQKVFVMRQVTLAVPTTKRQRGAADDASTRQIHILTTRTHPPTSQVIHRMGSRWRQENCFRYARMHFELDTHDCYAAGENDPTRLAPTPAKKHTSQQVLGAASDSSARPRPPTSRC